jgi:hypothetical protein
MVGDVARLVVEDLVARIEQRPQREVYRLRDADRHEDLVVGPVAERVVALHIRRDGPAQLEEPEVRGVVGLALLEGVDRGLADVPGRVEVRLADAERDDVPHLRDDLEEVADARLGQPGDVAWR